MGAFSIGVPPNKKQAKKTEEPKKEVVAKRPTLTSEDVENINFFKEDLESLDNEVAEADKIYGEIHKLWDNLTGQEYLPRNIKDVAELAKTMVSARTYKAQTINNRISLKKTIADMNYRNNGGGELEGAEQANATARQIINLIRQEGANITQPKPVVDKRTTEGKKRAQEEEVLAKTIEERLKSGEIKLGKNDKLVGTNEHIVVRYDNSKEEFVGVDNRTGKVIPDFPKDRLPDPKNLNKVSNSAAIMNDGSEIKMFDSLEFDDEYVDDAP